MPRDSSCTCNELIARVVALESGLLAVHQLINERDERYKLRSDAQDNAVKLSMDNSERAIAKAEIATEKRFDSVNEFRATLADQASKLMPRAEYDVQHRALEEKLNVAEAALEAKIISNENRINLIQQNLTSILARGGGMKDAWGYIVGIAGLVIAGLAVYFHAH